MKDKSKSKDQTVIFRASRKAVQSLDTLANMINVNRSEVLRRLIPDLSLKRKELQDVQEISVK
jgi:predicted transcriptional regulator